MSTVIVSGGLKHAFGQLWADGHFDDRKDGVWRLFCDIEAIRGISPFVPPPFYYNDALVEGKPDCLACLALLPPG